MRAERLKFIFVPGKTDGLSRLSAPDVLLPLLLMNMSGKIVPEQPTKYGRPSPTTGDRTSAGLHYGLFLQVIVDLQVSHRALELAGLVQREHERTRIAHSIARCIDNRLEQLLGLILERMLGVKRVKRLNR